jgi:hypothetical protein
MVDHARKNMRLRLGLALALSAVVGYSPAQDGKPAKPPAKKEKNAGQKAEASVGEFADKHNIWKRRAPKKKD